jgi:hypothetical protein
VTGQSMVRAERTQWLARAGALFACVACAAVFGAQATDARSRPKMNANVVRSVAQRYWQATVDRHCPGGRGLEGPVRFQFRGAYLSTVNPHFAVVRKQDDGCTFITVYFLHRSDTSRQDWQVVLAVPDSAQYCRSFTAHVPERVLTEFHIKAIRRGTIGNC